jgi:hypothetical protein
METKSKTLIAAIFAGIFVVLLLNNAFAFGISSFYYQGLKMYPGETKDIKLILQNQNEKKDITVRTLMTNGSDIAKLTDPSNIYTVPYQVNKEVHIEVSIPESAKPGDSYTITFDFSLMKNSDEGGLNFGMAIGKNIEVTVIEPVAPEIKPEVPSEAEEIPEAKPIGAGILIALLILIIGIIVTLLMRKKKIKIKSKSKSKRK